MSDADIGQVTEWMSNPAKMFDVAGQTAIVTGASGAFGRGIAITLAAQGANILLASGNEGELLIYAPEADEHSARISCVKSSSSSYKKASICEGHGEGPGSQKCCFSNFFLACAWVCSIGCK